MNSLIFSGGFFWGGGHTWNGYTVYIYIFLISYVGNRCDSMLYRLRSSKMVLVSGPEALSRRTCHCDEIQVP